VDARDPEPIGLATGASPNPAATSSVPWALQVWVAADLPDKDDKVTVYFGDPDDPTTEVVDLHGPSTACTTLIEQQDTPSALAPTAEALVNDPSRKDPGAGVYVYELERRHYRTVGSQTRVKLPTLISIGAEGGRMRPVPWPGERPGVVPYQVRGLFAVVGPTAMASGETLRASPGITDGVWRFPRESFQSLLWEVSNRGAEERAQSGIFLAGILVGLAANALIGLLQEVAPGPKSRGQQSERGYTRAKVIAASKRSRRGSDPTIPTTRSTAGRDGP
jgi:hypothetical protein